MITGRNLRTFRPNFRPGQWLARLRHDSLMRNSLYLMATTVSTSLLGYVYWAVLARNFTPGEVGLTSALIGLVTLSANLANLGLGSALVQLLPHTYSAQGWSLTLNTALLLVSLISLPAGLLINWGLPLFIPQISPQSGQWWWGLIIGIAILVWAWLSLVDAAFTAKRANGNLLARNLVFSMAKLGLAMATIPFGIGVGGLFGSWVGALTLGLIVAAILLKRLEPAYRFSLGGSSAQLKKLISPSIWHHFINIGGMAPMYLLPLIVTMRLSATANGYFYLTWMVAGLFFMVSPAVATALFAEGVHNQDGQAAIKTKIRASFRLIAALLGPAMVIFLVGGPLILNIFGAAYATQGENLLVVLTFSSIPDSVTNVYVSFLRMHGRLREAALLNLGMAFLALGISWLLLPIVGIVAVGVAWLLAQSAGCLMILVNRPRQSTKSN